MKVVAAYLLAVLGGHTSPSADDIKQILGAVGADANTDLLLSGVKGKDITRLIAAGWKKLALVPSRGGGVAVAAPDGGGGAAPAAAESKKEEKVESDEDDLGAQI